MVQGPCSVLLKEFTWKSLASMLYELNDFCKFYKKILVVLQTNTLNGIKVHFRGPGFPYGTLCMFHLLIPIRNEDRHNFELWIPAVLDVPAISYFAENVEISESFLVRLWMNGRWNLFRKTTNFHIVARKKKDTPWIVSNLYGLVGGWSLSWSYNNVSYVWFSRIKYYYVANEQTVFNYNSVGVIGLLRSSRSI